MHSIIVIPRGNVNVFSALRRGFRAKNGARRAALRAAGKRRGKTGFFARGNCISAKTVLQFSRIVLYLLRENNNKEEN
jgi:hypothetical protein